jgi:hypothetical protein
MPEDRFHVFWISAARESLKMLGQRAREVGLLDALKQVLRELNERLEREPLEVGELYRTRRPVVEQTAGHKLVGIDFAVDTEKKVVAVRRCWALPPRRAVTEASRELSRG